MKKLLAILSISLLVFGCESPRNIIDNFTLGISSDLMDYSASILAVDAADSGKVITDLTIEFTGANKNYIYDINGRLDVDFYQNVALFGLHKSQNPLNEEDARSVGIVVSAPGYVTYRGKVDFMFEEYQQSLQVPLISLDNPPAGVNHEKQVYGLTGGTTTQPISFDVPTTDSVTVGMSIELPVGLQFISSTGDTVTGSNLEIEVGQFDPSSEAATTVFPGGFSQDSIVQEDGSTESGEFLTAGFTAIDMYVDGQQVTNFNQPIQVTIELADSAYNPETDDLVQVGDSVPVWSYDEDDGSWVYETKGIVTQGTDGLELTYSTTHLSWWNLDFYYGRCCYYCASMKVNMPSDANGWYYYKVKYSNTNSSRRSSYVYLYDGKVIRFMRAANYNFDVEFYQNSTLIGAKRNMNICNYSTQHNVNLTPTVPVRLYLNVEGICPDNATRSFRPSFYIYYKPTTRWYYSYLTYASQGQATTTTLEEGSTYDFKIYFYDYTSYTWRTYETTKTVNTGQTYYDFVIDVSPYGLCD